MAGTLWLFSIKKIREENLKGFYMEIRFLLHNLKRQIFEGYNYVHEISLLLTLQWHLELKYLIELTKENECWVSEFRLLIPIFWNTIFQIRLIYMYVHIYVYPA